MSWFFNEPNVSHVVPLSKHSKAFVIFFGVDECSYIHVFLSSNTLISYNTIIKYQLFPLYLCLCLNFTICNMFNFGNYSIHFIL
ncbi:hypothetical protein Lalb_Chr06g0176041 [Lupinus albus]|uniref:Uncharacterized protein n=1 Tax=Lupinus albus TaxID=3870 RepID=A0A6A4QF60_LUPAL|nr:hypothetical protein Lalb_Chr06g0176041 [Lupinus albus]